MKALSKRAFLGATAGGAIAGPSIAKSLVQEVSGRQLNIAGCASSMPYDTSPEPDPNWQVNRLKQLFENRKRVTGERDFEGFIPSQSELHAASHYDALRSVSTNARRLMFNDRLIEMRRAGELRWIDREIEEIKKQLGPLSWVVS